MNHFKVYTNLQELPSYIDLRKKSVQGYTTTTEYRCHIKLQCSVFGHFINDQYLLTTLSFFLPFSPFFFLLNKSNV